MTVCVLWGLSPYNMVASYQQLRGYQASGATLVRCYPDYTRDRLARDLACLEWKRAKLGRRTMVSVEQIW